MEKNNTIFPVVFRWLTINNTTLFLYTSILFVYTYFGLGAWGNAVEALTIINERNTSKELSFLLWHRHSSYLLFYKKAGLAYIKDKCFQWNFKIFKTRFMIKFIFTGHIEITWKRLSFSFSVGYHSCGFCFPCGIVYYHFYMVCACVAYYCFFLITKFVHSFVGSFAYRKSMF